jgi:hypothetical protein
MKLLVEGMEALEQWMHQDGQTNQEIVYWRPKYILLRGQQTMADLGSMSASMQQAAVSQGAISWCKFTEDKVSTKIASIHRTTCKVSPCMIDGNDWMRHFIFHVLHITHSQGIFRNVTLYTSICGTLRLKSTRRYYRRWKPC